MLTNVLCNACEATEGRDVHIRKRQSRAKIPQLIVISSSQAVTCGNVSLI